LFQFLIRAERAQEIRAASEKPRLTAGAFVLLNVENQINTSRQPGHPS
jgi:hypothetical protein